MSNDLKKTIKINPEIFNMGGKTKKNKERKQYPINVPLISPNKCPSQHFVQVPQLLFVDIHLL